MKEKLLGMKNKEFAYKCLEILISSSLRICAAFKKAPVFSGIVVVKTFFIYLPHKFTYISLNKYKQYN